MAIDLENLPEDAAALRKLVTNAELENVGLRDRGAISDRGGNPRTARTTLPRQASEDASLDLFENPIGQIGSQIDLEPQICGPGSISQGFGLLPAVRERVFSFEACVWIG